MEVLRVRQVVEEDQDEERVRPPEKPAMGDGRLAMGVTARNCASALEMNFSGPTVDGSARYSKALASNSVTIKPPIKPRMMSASACSR